MMQRKKNIRLFIIFMALVMVNTAVVFLDVNRSDQYVDRYKFTLIDTSQVDKITLKQHDRLISFEKTGEGWLVNQKYPTDERMMGLIFAVMTSVETSRSVGASADNEVRDKLSKEGVLVEFYSGKDDISAFYTGGNPTRTLSYMMKKSESVPYVVYIPGYSSYLAGLFALKLSDWRNKKAFETSWSSLKSLKLESVKDNLVQLHIAYQNNFFKVVDVSGVDTVKMMNYLETTTALTIDQYIEPGEFPDYDSLISAQPEYIIFIEDTDAAKNRQLQIFPPLEGKGLRLGQLLPSKQMVIIRQKKVDGILAANSDFERIE